MVNYGLVSVGILVEPEQPPGTISQPLTIALGYSPEMADLVIKVSEEDNESSNDESDHPESNPSIKSGGSTGSIKSKEKYRTLERVESSSCERSSQSKNTTRNRPSCRKSRSESQLLYSGGTNKAYLSGIRNPSSALKSCEYYRQKILQESLHQSSDYSDWMNFGAIQKTAGQKVVQKLTAQQRALEAEQQKKKISSSPARDSMYAHPNSLPKDFLLPKRKPGRLEPIVLTVKISE